jgi:hypothetical protein
MKPWKIQKFFGDLVYDLRSRGLLPVAALLVVGMVAVPVVLANSSGSDGAPVPAAQVSAAELAPENQTAVLAYSPGVRDYKERLSELQAKDPFKQQYAGTDAAASALDQSVPSEATEVSTAPTEGSGGAEVETTETGGKRTGAKKGKGSKTRYVYYEADVEVGEKDLTEIVDDVEELSFLPNEAAPVLVFLGVNGSGKRATFMVAKDASNVTTTGACSPSPSACQLLTLSDDQTAEMFYAVTGKTYTVRVARIQRVVSSKPPK